MARVVIELDGDASGAVDALEDTEQALVGVTEESDKTDKASGRLTRSAGALATGIGLVAAGATAAAAGLAAASRQALEQERVMQRLEHSLQGVGIAYEESENQLAGFFAQQQRLTRFGDDQTAEMLNQIALATAALGPGMDDLFRYTRLAQDVAEATGRGVEGSARIVAQAAAGNTRSLMELVPAYRDNLRELNKLTDASARGAEAIAILDESFGGAAESINPFDRALARLSNGAGDAVEALGDLVVQSPEVAAGVDGMADSVDRLALAMSEGGEFEAFGDTIRTSAEIAAQALSGLFDVALSGLDALSRAEAGISSALADMQAADAEKAAAGLRAGAETGELQNMAAIRRNLRRAGRESDIERLLADQTQAGGFMGIGGADVLGVEGRALAAELAAGLTDTAQSFRAQSINELATALRDETDDAIARIQNASGLSAGDGGTGGGGGGAANTDAEQEAEVFDFVALQRQAALARLESFRAEVDARDRARDAAKLERIEMKQAAEVVYLESERKRLLELDILKDDIDAKDAARAQAEQERASQAQRRASMVTGAIGDAADRASQDGAKLGEVARQVAGEQIKALGQAALAEAAIKAAQFNFAQAALLTAAGIGAIVLGNKLGAKGGGAAGRAAAPVGPSAQTRPENVTNVSLVNNVGLVGDNEGFARMLGDQINYMADRGYGPDSLRSAG